MRISFNWLKRYIDVKNTPESIADTLTSIGLEVESIDHLGKKYDGFVVGEVLDVQKHPNADRLSVCLVRISASSKGDQIVCGAPNVKPGQKVIVGLPGATVPHNQHDQDKKPFVLTKATIRGVESHGMICSEYELGLGDDKSGIKILEPNVRCGTSLAEYLKANDVAFELGITPNRSDCLCHIGVARDLAAAVNKKIKQPLVHLKENSSSPTKKVLQVKVENTKDCPRYSARMINNVTVADSPEWLQSLLLTAGIRPINNVVDVTNFVMLECGQPLHAFDYSTLNGKKIVVKTSHPDQKFTTLDGQEHILDGSELMICDAERPIAMAGVMGGQNSEISTGTTSVVLESAYFSPSSIRRTARKHGFNTDASYRFERGIDPNAVVAASDRAAALIAELSGGEVLSGCLDVYPKKISPKKIALRLKRIGDILGIDIPSVKVKAILQSLGIQIAKGPSSGTLQCTVPTFRPDIEQEIDLIEEVARHFGYDNIPNKLTETIAANHTDQSERRVNEIREWCEANGFNEILTNSLIEKSLVEKFFHNYLKVQNPLSSDHEVLRPSLLPTMLQSVAYNYNHGMERLQFFEIGNIFRESSDQNKTTVVDGYYEQNTLGICLSGYANELQWYEKQRNWDIYDLKGIVLSLLQMLGLDNIHLIYYDASSSLTESTVGIEINNTYVGFIGKCRKEILDAYKIENDVYYSELNLEPITHQETTKTYTGFSKFPTVRRDVAFVVDSSILVGDVEKAITQAGGSIIQSVTLFDVFSGSSVGEGKKSIAFSVNLNSSEKTLTEKEIEATVKQIIQSVTSQFDATLRSI